MIESPKRWHLYVVDLEPNIGTKPGKQRPCISIQPNEFSEAGLRSTVILPLTSKLCTEDASPLRVRIAKGICGLKQTSEVLMDQILAWDNELFRKDMGEIPEAIQEEIRRSLADFLDL